MTPRRAEEASSETFSHALGQKLPVAEGSFCVDYATETGLRALVAAGLATGSRDAST